MAAPDPLNWIGQAIQEVYLVLTADVNFMDAAALSGGIGVVTKVARHDLDLGILPTHGDVEVGLGQGDVPGFDGKTAAQTEYWMPIRVQIAARGERREAMLAKVKRAASVLHRIIEKQNAPTGGKFASYAVFASMGPIRFLEAFDQGDPQQGRGIWTSSAETTIRLLVVLVVE